jgi:hypothetical protein
MLITHPSLTGIATGASTASSPTSETSLSLEARSQKRHLPLEKRGAEPALHEDVSDWIKKDGDPTKLIEICRGIPIAGAAPTIINIGEWDDQPIPEQECLIAIRGGRPGCSRAKAARAERHVSAGRGLAFDGRGRARGQGQ